MSVPKDSRKESKLALAVLAREHATYVIQITKNPKNFDPAYRTALTDDLIKSAKDIYHYIWAANNVMVRSKEDYANRRSYQKKAILMCNTLIADMEVAQSVFHISGKRMRYWAAMVVEIRNKTRAWIESDAERYKAYR